MFREASVFRKPPLACTRIHFTVMNTDSVDLVSQVHTLSDSLCDIIHHVYGDFVNRGFHLSFAASGCIIGGKWLLLCGKLYIPTHKPVFILPSLFLLVLQE